MLIWQCLMVLRWHFGMGVISPSFASEVDYPKTPKGQKMSTVMLILYKQEGFEICFGLRVSVL